MKKWKWLHNLLTLCHRQMFLTGFLFLLSSLLDWLLWQFFFLLQMLNQKSGNRKTHVWLLSNIWRLEKVRDTKFGTNGSKNPKKGYRMLQNARVTAFPVHELIWENQQGWVGREGWGKITPSPTQIRVNRALLISILLYLFFQMVIRQIGKFVNIMKDK